jgi:drug/metabolite transporter (DMT)-like permease
MEGGPSGGNTGTIIYFECDDCATEAGRVKASGGKVTKGKSSIGQYGYIALVTDTENNGRAALDAIIRAHGGERTQTRDRGARDRRVCDRPGSHPRAVVGRGASSHGLLAAVVLVADSGLLSWRAMGGLAAPSRFTLVAGAAFAFDLAFWHYGIANTSVSKATVLGNITPVVVTAVAWLVFHTRPAPLFLVAVALSVTGAAVMAFAKGAGAIGPNPLLGDILSLVTSVWYAIYFLAVGAARRHHGATQVMFWSSLTGRAGVVGSRLAADEQVLPRAAGGWVACVALAGVHVGGQGAIAWSLGRLTPATAAVTVLVQPVGDDESSGGSCSASCSAPGRRLERSWRWAGWCSRSKARRLAPTPRTPTRLEVRGDGFYHDGAGSTRMDVHLLDGQPTNCSAITTRCRPRETPAVRKSPRCAGCSGRCWR